MEHKIVIWQDDRDPDRYHVGAKYCHGNISLWFTVYRDGLDEIFGRDVLNYASKGSKIVIEIKTRIVPQ